jgi:hypothetical protein
MNDLARGSLVVGESWLGESEQLQGQEIVQINRASSEIEMTDRLSCVST